MAVFFFFWSFGTFKTDFLNKCTFIDIMHQVTLSMSQVVLTMSQLTWIWVLEPFKTCFPNRSSESQHEAPIKKLFGLRQPLS